MLPAAALLDLWESAPAPAERAAATLAAWTGDDSAAGLPLDQVNHRLLQLRAAAFGSDLAFYSECSACGQAIEFEVAARSLARHGFPDVDEPLGIDGLVIECRPPTTVDLIAAMSAPDSRRSLFERCLVRATSDGQEVPVADLPDEVVTAVAAALDERHPLLDVRLEVTCSECGHAWSELLDISAHLWTDIDRAARRLLHEVALLARRYGWAEHDVLAMSDRRRAHYLELAS